MIIDMRSANFTIFLQALVVFLITATQVRAGPLSFQRRNNLVVYNPKIIEPSGTTTWKAGTAEIVSWDTSDAPDSISNNGHVVLKSVPTGETRSQLKHLAGPFDLRMGQISVTLPPDLTSGQYRVILFGDSANESDEFPVYGAPPSADAEDSDSENPDPVGSDANQQ